MTSSTQTITPLRQRMIDDMRMRKLSPKTQAGYIRVVRRWPVSSGDRPIPPASKIYAVISCIWLITGSRRFH